MTEPRGRGRALVRNPAEAIAIAKCWLATWTRRVEAGGSSPVGLPPTNSFHPGKCAFCGMPRDLLIQMLEEFQAWSGVSSYDEQQPLRLEMEQWNSLPGHEQARLIAKAQMGEPEPEPDGERPWP